MSVRFTNENDIIRCVYEKDIIASAVACMREQLNVRLESDQEWKGLELDISGVEKIDSLGINLIVWLFRLTRSTDKSFKITGCNNQLMKLFTLFRLQDQFTIEPLETDK